MEGDTLGFRREDVRDGREGQSQWLMTILGFRV